MLETNHYPDASASTSAPIHPSLLFLHLICQVHINSLYITFIALYQLDTFNWKGITVWSVSTASFCLIVFLIPLTKYTEGVSWFMSPCTVFIAFETKLKLKHTSHLYLEPTIVCDIIIFISQNLNYKTMNLNKALPNGNSRTIVFCGYILVAREKSICVISVVCWDLRLHRIFA